MSKIYKTKLNHMNKYFFILLLSTIVFMQCKPTTRVEEVVTIVDPAANKKGDTFTINLKPGKHFNHPTYVVWAEDMAGNYLRTIYITESYASGIFGHQMQGDSIWLKTKGPSYQPAALPYWTHKKPGSKDGAKVPTPQNPFVDAYTGATQKKAFNFETSVTDQLPFRVLMEVNQTWDWNEHWTNNLYPDSPAYKRSAQPSVIYGVTINEKSGSYYLNPIGHGDPKGDSGKLFTNLKTMTTALHIFDTMEISLNSSK